MLKAKKIIWEELIEETEKNGYITGKINGINLFFIQKSKYPEKYPAKYKLHCYLSAIFKQNEIIECVSLDEAKYKAQKYLDDLMCFLL